MEFSPFFRRPYYYYNQDRYTNLQYNRYNNYSKQDKRQDYNVPAISEMQQKRGQNFKYKDNETKKDTPSDSADVRNVNMQSNPIFEIFGIKLFFDDILIIALIFFLYDEGVEDNLLFISLILLLLS